MSRQLSFKQKAWDDYTYWQTKDKKTLKRINQLIKDTLRDPFNGIGKPEPLKNDLAGLWSRRIDDANRILYRVTDDIIEIIQCRTHYNDH